MGATEQNKPVMDGAQDATDAEKLEGIVEQTEADVNAGVESAADAEQVVHDRAAESGVDEG